MKPEPNIDDHELLSAIAGGSERALAQLIEKHWKDIYYLSLTYLQRAVLAEEATQDIFTKVWLQRSKLNEIDNFGAWLTTVSRNHIFSELRKSLNREPVDFLDYAEPAKHRVQRVPSHGRKSNRTIARKTKNNLPLKPF